MDVLYNTPYQRKEGNGYGCSPATLFKHAGEQSIWPLLSPTRSSRHFLYTTQDRHRARLVISSRTYISWFYSDWVVAKVLKAGTSQLQERLILLRLLRERRWCLISVFRIQSHSSETESGSGRAHFRPLCLAYSQSYQRADS